MTNGTNPEVMDRARQAAVTAELEEAIQRILRSASRRKLIIAGPGTGKTSFFKTLLRETRGTADTRLVLTFIGNLKDGLEKDLSDFASVYTLHGYCQSLLHRYPDLRAGLTQDFRCLPGLISLIKDDWEYLRGGEAPEFAKRMQGLTCQDDEATFYFQRANYYDAVDFDDSVYRTLTSLRRNRAPIRGYDLVLIDEYQDFNRMEAAVIDLLAEANSIVVAGDDDQALYSRLRGASWDHIRALRNRQDYEFFSLPFCMRCPEVIVAAVDDVVRNAGMAQRLQGRIVKDYRYFEPVKGADSRRYPRIGLVTTTVQRLNANYFGRYIAQAIQAIPAEEIEEAREKSEPAVLVIGGRQYLDQIASHLVEAGYRVDRGREREARLERSAGLEILAENPESNLGWRVILESLQSVRRRQLVRTAAESEVPLHRVLPDDFKATVLEEARQWAAQQEDAPPAQPAADEGPWIKLTSFESSKGLSAQHVFILGLHAEELPRDAANINDLEVCRLLVGLTRTKKKCSFLITNRFAQVVKRPSVFLGWIRRERYETTRVDAQYWNRGRQAQ